MKKAGLVLSIALVMMLPIAAAGQDRTAELRLALRQLQRTVDALPSGIKPPRLVQAVTWLVRNADADRGRAAQISEEYVRTLQRVTHLLQVPSGAVLDDVTNELEAKVEHCKALGLGMGGSVLLRVSTRRGPQTVSDWQVFYLLKIYERVSGAAPLTFPTLSTPTETNLDPGRYWLWARDPATGRTSEPTLVSVAGRKEFLVDLPVP